MKEKGEIMSGIINAARNFHKKYAEESPLVKYPFGDIRTNSDAVDSIQTDLKNGVVLAPLVLGVSTAAVLSATALPAVGVAVVAAAVTSTFAGAGLKSVFSKHAGGTLKAALSDILDNTMTKLGFVQDGFKEKFDSHPEGHKILNAYKPTMAEKVIDKIRSQEMESSKRMRSDSPQLGS